MTAQAMRPGTKGSRGRVQGIRDPLSEQTRMQMLRSALEASTRENAQLRREVARLRAENARLRATGGTPEPRDVERPRRADGEGPSDAHRPALPQPLEMTTTP